MKNKLVKLLSVVFATGFVIETLSAAEWPEALDDCDIIYEVVEGIYPPREPWTKADVVRFVTGAKEGDYRIMKFDHRDTKGDLYCHIISERDAIGNWTHYQRFFEDADSVPQGYTPKENYAPTRHVPDTDECKAKFDKYMNLSYVTYKRYMTDNWAWCLYESNYVGSKLFLGAYGRDNAGVGGTFNINGTGIYSIEGSDGRFLTINVLKHVSYAPKITKTSEKYYNGTNYLFYFKDFMEKDSDFYTYTVEDVTPHASITVNHSGKFFYVGLRDKPINAYSTAKYKLKIASGYGNTEAEITFYLYPSSLLIQSETGGNTDPPPGLVGGEPGDGVTVTSFPDETHVFDKWIGSAVTVANEKDNPINITLTNEQLTLKPQYTEVPWVDRCDLLLSFNPKKGTLKINDQELTNSSTLRLEKGSLIKLQAVAKDGYVFSSWDGDMSAAFKTDDYVEFYLNDTKDISAIFEKVETETGTETGTGTGTSTTISTIGGGTKNSGNNVLTFDKAALDALLKNSSNSVGTRTGSNSVTTNSNPFGKTSSIQSSSPPKSYSSDFNIAGDRGDGASSAVKGGNIHDVDQLRNSEGYFFKYKVYEGVDFSLGEGPQTYYSTDEVEQYRTIISNLLNFIQGE